MISDLTKTITLSCIRQQLLRFTQQFQTHFVDEICLIWSYRESIIKFKFANEKLFSEVKILYSVNICVPVIAMEDKNLNHQDFQIICTFTQSLRNLWIWRSLDSIKIYVVYCVIIFMLYLSSSCLFVCLL